ncbi:MAG: Ribonuclease VapC20 [Candidatus Scalindua rubra]|uniref:Ribonuclease VapC20 n=1 Tax=Candidatus Scalindua rubra TaxID=1872076 RepID=A0A1E3XCX1_9BACT|nr:MAG: Ribonuclease VapC20 [Candidatus Scalindua rubra]
MSKDVFVDTSAWQAFIDRDDQYHLSASNWLNSEGRVRRLISTDYIFSETVTCIRFRSGHSAAVKAGNMLLTSRLVWFIDVSREVRNDAWTIFQKYKEWDLSFVDCTSFALMKKLNVETAFTFDKDFQRFGFIVVPTKKHS